MAAVAVYDRFFDKFTKVMEYFNRFGENPVSCAIETEVLKTVIREKFQENALQIGEFLKAELQQLSNEFPIIGNVRG